ncbi:MAG: Hint domain-containing protein [Pseudomonadota bacterium]
MATNSSDNPATTGDDTISGTAGDDQLTGGSGNDTLISGLGDDVLSGDGPLPGQLFFRFFEHNRLSTVNQILGENGQQQLATEVAQGYITDLNERTLAQTIRGSGGGQDLYALVIEGNLEIETAGNYTFRIRSDDGMRLEIDGQVVVVDDGDHAPRNATSPPITLSQGSHTIRILYYEDFGQEAMNVSVRGPGGGPFEELFQSGLVGTPGDDGGVPGDDILDAGGGSDIITTGGGADTILGTSFGDNSDDTITDFDPSIDVADLSTFFPGIVALRDATVAGPDGLTVTLPDGSTVVFEGLSDPQQLTETNTLVTCFTKGTLIETEVGFTPIEDIIAGDLVETRDHGLRPVRWIGQRELWAGHLIANPHHRPVRIPAGSLGEGRPWRDLTVSPQHRVLMEAWRAELLFDTTEVLIPATMMCGVNGIHRLSSSRVSYYHLMFDAHEIVRSEGAWTESFHLGPQALNGFGTDAALELLELFPELGKPGAIDHGKTARPCVRRFEMPALMVSETTSGPRI